MSKIFRLGSRMNKSVVRSIRRSVNPMMRRVKPARSMMRSVNPIRHSRLSFTSFTEEHNNEKWHSKYQDSLKHPTQEYVAEERPLSQKYSGKEFETFKERRAHLFDFIYEGLQPLLDNSGNRAVLDLHYKNKTGEAMNDERQFFINIALVGDFILSYEDDKEIVTLFDPLSNHTYEYKYNESKDDWVEANHPDQRLLIKLYTEIDSHCEGYPHFGLEHEFS